MECYNSCNSAYFPSLFCQNLNQQNLNYKITLHGNTFTKFYKYPDPTYVKKNEKTPETAKPTPASETESSTETGKQRRLAAVYNSRMSVLASSTFDMHQKNYEQCVDLASKNLDHVFTIDGSER